MPPIDWPAAAQPAQAVVPVPLPNSSPNGELSCANFDMSAAHLLTDAHYASLNTGTNNDTQPSFADMNEALKVKGVAAWTAMGRGPAAWDTAIVFYC